MREHLNVVAIIVARKPPVSRLTGQVPSRHSRCSVTPLIGTQVPRLTSATISRAFATDCSAVTHIIPGYST